MPKEPYHFIAFVVSAIVVFGCSFFIRSNRFKQGETSNNLSNESNISPSAIVRLGGLFIILGYSIALLIVWKNGGFTNLPLQPTNKAFEIFMVIIGGLFFFLIGLTEDLLNFSSFSKLRRLIRGSRFQWLAQIGFAFVWAWMIGVPIKSLTVPFLGVLSSLPSAIGAIITAILLVFMANFFKWSDRQNGLAAGIASIASVILLMVSLVLGTIADKPAAGATLIAAALAGATLGFLRHNFDPKNQVFMGSGGAYFIGFTLASGGMIDLIKMVTTAAVILSYLILSFPLLDIPLKRLSTILAVMWEGILQFQSPFINHNSELKYQYHILRAGLSQRLSILLIYSLILILGGLVLTVLSIFTNSFDFTGLAYSLVGVLLLGYTLLEVKKYPPKE
jgi:UDP-GlcNAc:undecaprenyl-phosphate GlcNAc-1-phosphate transferase